MTKTTENKTEKKAVMLNIRIPASAVIGENKKGVLIATTSFSFWLPKQMVHKNKLADFMQCYTIGLVETWKMKFTLFKDGKEYETTAIKLAEKVDAFFKIYNPVILDKETDLPEDVAIDKELEEAEEILANI